MPSLGKRGNYVVESQDQCKLKHFLDSDEFQYLTKFLTTATRL